MPDEAARGIRYDFHHERATEDELIALCAEYPRERALLQVGGAFLSPTVAKVSDDAVVKFGRGVQREEADNLQVAHRLLSPHIVRVPRLFRFFSRHGVGYLVMEFLSGREPASDEYPDAVERTARVLDAFARLPGTAPGPLRGGASRGPLWEDRHPTHTSVVDMEVWWRARQARKDPPVSFQGCELVLVHGDLAPRNILFLDDGQLGLLDWASAGWYPRLFEHVSQSVLRRAETDFHVSMLGAMRPLREEEGEWMVEPMIKAWENSIRFAFPAEILSESQPEMKPEKTTSGARRMCIFGEVVYLSANMDFPPPPPICKLTASPVQT